MRRLDAGRFDGFRRLSADNDTLSLTVANGRRAIEPPTKTTCGCSPKKKSN